MSEVCENPAFMRTSVSPLGDVLLKAWDAAPDKDALVFPSGRQTYDELCKSTLRRARGMVALGIKPGDHIGILMPAGIDFVQTLFAAAMIGAVSVLINNRYRVAELAHIVEDAELVAVFTNSESDAFVDFTKLLTQAYPDVSRTRDPQRLSLPGAPKLRRLVVFGGKVAPGFIDQAAFDHGIEDTAEATVHGLRLAVRLRSTCMILYTSGTSGQPKGCMISHEAICREFSFVARHRWAFKSDERVWSPMPMFHIGALFALFCAIEVAGTFIGQGHFDASESFRQFASDKPTMLFLPFVTFHQALISHSDWQKTDLSSVRLINGCFSQMPPSIGEAYRTKVPNAQYVGTFGMSEMSGVVSTGGMDADPKFGFQALGYPLQGVNVRIVDPQTGMDVEPGCRGEILACGYNMFEGYYRDPAKTAEAIDAEGWYHSGDIGSLDENGHLCFHGRFKDMLKVGGENVAAAEVEAVLNAHPAVELAQVIGLPDERLAEVPAAWIKLKRDASATEGDLIAYAKDRIASFKVPRHIRFIGEWPMSASKIQKFTLRLRLMEELGVSD